MENTEEKGLKKVDEGFFTKMVGFFKNIFGKKNNTLDVEFEEVETPEEKIIENNMDLTKEINLDAGVLEVLQQDYEDGKIKEEYMTDEQYESLKKLYEDQIDKLNQSIEKSKEKIIAMKKKKEVN